MFRYGEPILISLWHWQKINSANAEDVYVYTTYENGIRLRHHVRTESIRQVDGCIEAMVVHEYHGYVIRFENT